jgi:hypothetical protein
MKKFLALLILLTLSLNTFAGIQLSSNFTVNTALPIDDRMEVATLVERDALPALRRWEGMIVYVKETEEHFALIGGLTDDFWAPVGSGKGGIAEFTPFTEYDEKDVVFHNNRIYYAKDAMESGAVFDPDDWTELAPVSQIKSEDSVDYIISPKIELPNRQLTIDEDNNKARIETGNNNLVPNPSGEFNFAGWEVPAGTTLSTDYVTDGKNSFKFDPATGTRQAYTMFTIPSGLVGKDLEFSVDVAASANLSICTIGTEGFPCAAYIGGSGVQRITVAAKPVSTTGVGIAISRPTTAATAYEHFDNVYVGIPKDAEVVTLPFKNTTRPESCGLTTSDFEGFGTVSDINLNCKRDGSKLLITGNFKTGTVQSIVAKINLKYRGSSLAVSPLAYPSISPYSSVGIFFRNAVATNNGGALLSLGSLSYITFSNPNVFGAGSYNPLTPTDGTGIAGSAEVVNINASIEIAQWSDHTNAAIVACKEGPVKCAEEYHFEVDAAGTSTSTLPVGQSFVSCSRPSTGLLDCTFTGLGLANPLKCDVSQIGQIDNFATFQFITRTTTSFRARSASVAGTLINTPMSFKCSKTGTDVNASTANIIVKNDAADIRSTEFWTGGYDYIVGKPIYKRCHRVASDITTNGATLVTWPANLNPVMATKFNADVWTFTPSYVDGSTYISTIKYYRNTGIVEASIVGTGMKVGSGTEFCMNYTK